MFVFFPFDGDGVDVVVVEGGWHVVEEARRERRKGTREGDEMGDRRWR